MSITAITFGNPFVAAFAVVIVVVLVAVAKLDKRGRL